MSRFRWVLLGGLGACTTILGDDFVIGGTAGTAGGGAETGGNGGEAAQGGGAGTGGMDCETGTLDCACGTDEACPADTWCVAGACTDEDPYATVASDVENPYGLAVDDDYVYYTSGAQATVEIRSYAKVDATDALVKDAMFFVFDLDAADGYVYYADFATGSVGRKSATSSDEDVHPDFVEKPNRIAVSGIWVFFNEQETPYRLTRQSITFDEDTEIKPGMVNPYALHATSSWVYWSEYDDVGSFAGQIFRNAATGNPSPEQLVFGEERVIDIAGDSERLWWVTGDPSTPGGPGVIRTLDLMGVMQAEDFITTDTGAGRLASDDDHLYWIEPGGDQTEPAAGRVMRMPRDGGTPIVLASEQATPCALVLDDTAVYWANLGPAGGLGSVERRLK